MFRRRRLPIVRSDTGLSRAVDTVRIRKRNRVILKVSLVVTLGIDTLLGLALLYLIFLHMPYFNLRQAEVTGNRRLSREEVIEASELEGGINLLTVNLVGVADKLRRHPWIRSASVYRRFPGRITIEIEERTPVGIVNAGKLYYLDEQAEVFTRLLPGEPVNYPLFSGIDPEQLQRNDPEVKELLRTGLALLDLLERKSKTLAPTAVAEIQLNLDEGLTLITVSGRAIVLGKANFELKLERYARLKRLLTQRGEWNNARTIDLDFEDRALVRSGKARIQG